MRDEYDSPVFSECRSYTNCKKTGTELILGTGRFVAPRTLEVALGDEAVRRLRGAEVIVSTGTRAALDAIPGLAKTQPLTHVEALEFDRVYEHLVVIGSRYVGIEFAQAMRRFGSRVTLIGRRPRLTFQEDQEVSEALRSHLEDEGITALLNTRINRVSGRSGEAVSIFVEQNGTE